MKKIKNKNYYDWLELNKNASPEVIEKAYKTLVKKYHPDLQNAENKKESEDIIKNINEAYEVLSDPVKKQEYDNLLQEQSVSKEDYDKLQQELNNLKSQKNAQRTYYNTQQQNAPQPNYDNNYNTENTVSQEDILYQQEIEHARQKAYHDAYIQDMKNRGYKIRYKKTPKDYLALALTVLVLVFICALLWFIPITRNWLIELYESNFVIKMIVDIIIMFLQAIASTISLIFD